MKRLRLALIAAMLAALTHAIALGETQTGDGRAGATNPAEMSPADDEARCKASGQASAPFNPDRLPALGYVRTFDDDFHHLDASRDGIGHKWETRWFYGRDNALGTDYAYLDPAICRAGLTPFKIADETLSIVAQSTSPQLSRCVTAPSTGGHLDTYHSFSQQYGYFEVNAKVSDVYGTIWAFWLLPKDGSWPPEIDMPEVLGRRPDQLPVTNYSAQGGFHQYQFVPVVGDLSKAFHTYGMLWDAANITWFLDGRQVAQTETRADEHRPFFIILEHGAGHCGDKWAECPEPGFTSMVQVKWVRAWKKCQ